MFSRDKTKWLKILHAGWPGGLVIAGMLTIFLNEVPGCFFFVGSANAERGLNTPHHSPTFDFDERALEIGVRMLTSVALEYLEQA